MVMPKKYIFIAQSIIKKMRKIQGMHMKNKKPLSVSVICGIILVIALVIAIIVKSTVTFSDLVSGKWQFEIPIIKEIIFNICMGLVASAILTLLNML